MYLLKIGNCIIIVGPKTLKVCETLRVFAIIGTGPREGEEMPFDQQREDYDADDEYSSAYYGKDRKGSLQKHICGGKFHLYRY